LASGCWVEMGGEVWSADEPLAEPRLPNRLLKNEGTLLLRVRGPAMRLPSRAGRDTLVSTHKQMRESGGPIRMNTESHAEARTV
jgi:hypothetical protein